MDKEDIKRLIASLPENVQDAFKSGEENFPEAFSAALDELPQEQAVQVFNSLLNAGLIGEPPDIEQELESFDPLLNDIAAVATGDASTEVMESIESAIKAFPELDRYLGDPVRKIWDGERDIETLVSDLDPVGTLLVRRLLDIINRPSPEEVIASMPEKVQMAFALDKDAAVSELNRVLNEMPQEAAAEVVQRLRAAKLVR